MALCVAAVRPLGRTFYARRHDPLAQDEFLDARQGVALGYGATMCQIPSERRSKDEVPQRERTPVRKKTAATVKAGHFLAVILVAFTGLAGQLSNLTLLQQRSYLVQAESQRTRTLPLFAPRGIIYDRNMKPLASNQAAYRLLVRYPYYNQSELVQRLSEILGVSPVKLQNRVDAQKGRPYEPVELADRLTHEQYVQILERRQELSGVELESYSIRVYPQKQLAAHLLGHVGEIGPEQLKELEAKGYILGEVIGQSGLEAFYDSYLRGAPGVRQVEVNNAFEPLAEVQSVQPRPGLNLVMTVDAELQGVTERALDWQMHRLQTVTNPGDGHPYPKARAGAAVVVDVKTGAVLAMASRPAYDPNIFVGGISSRDWTGLNSPLMPLLNRSVQAAYHPGSTWKMLTGTAALTAGLTTPEERIFSGAQYEPTGQRDWLPGGHGWVNLVDALRLSSDIYFYEMGRRLGIERQVEFARVLGFGRATGVDLPAEAAGFLPDSAYRDENGWWLGQTTSLAIGQIVTATPLQLARYTAALANGGKMMKPYLVQFAQDAEGRIVHQTVPEQAGTLPVSPEVLQKAIEGMKRVNLPGGTSDFAVWPLPGIATAGKTGTAENPGQDDYGLYVGFAPADDPQIAVAVVIEQAGHGSSVSPVARSIFGEYFGVQLPAGDPARIPDDFSGPPHNRAK